MMNCVNNGDNELDDNIAMVLHVMMGNGASGNNVPNFSRDKNIQCKLTYIKFRAALKRFQIRTITNHLKSTGFNFRFEATVLFHTEAEILLKPFKTLRRKIIDRD